MEWQRSSPTDNLKDTVLQDLRRRDIRRNLRRDFQDLYRFYFNDEERSRLKSMGKFKRFFVTGWWLFKALLLNLPPVRRLMVVLGILLFLVSRFRFQVGDFVFDFDFTLLSFLIVLAVLLLELRDKLLARDELAVGRAVQLALLPDRNPEVSGWDIWMYTRPANDVGGDLVDYLSLDGSAVSLTLGDVSGKGLGAALLMAKLQATVRALATETASLEELGRRINAIFCRDQVSGRFATMVHLVIEPDSGRVRMLNAGHMPPLTLTEQSVVSEEPVAPPLGILPEARYVEQELNVDPGNLLLVYSDGVTEAQSPEKDLYGEERLEALLSRFRGLDARATGERIIREIETFVGEDRMTDDLSLILLRRKG